MAFTWPLVAIIAALSVLPRIANLAIPFHRDEGVYAYVADVIVRGGLPYVNAFDHKPPVIYYLFALSYKLFGHRVESPRILAALFMLAACILAFLIVRRLTASFTAALVAMPLLGLTTSAWVYTGFSTEPEIFLVPFMLAGIFALIDDPPSLWQFGAAGLSFGTALMIKQTVAPIAVAVTACALLTLVHQPQFLAKAALVAFVAGVTPLLLVAGFFTLNGAFVPFWDAVFVYNVHFANAVSHSESLSQLKWALPTIIGEDPVTWGAGAAGIIGFIFTAPSRHHRSLVLAWTFAAVVSVAIGKHFYGHHFIFMVVVLAICAALAIGQLQLRLPRAAMITLAVLIIIIDIKAGAQHLFDRSKAERERVYGYLGTLSTMVGGYLAGIVKPGEQLFLVGSEAQILFYSGLDSATRFSFFYPLKQSATTGPYFTEAISVLTNRMPEYMTLVGDSSSHLLASYDQDPVFAPLADLFADYRLAGAAFSGLNRFFTGQEALYMCKGQIVDGAIYLFRRPDRALAGDSARLAVMLGRQPLDP